MYSLCNHNLPEIRTGDSVTITAWCEHKVKYLGEYSSGTYRYGTLTEAQTECLKRNGTVSSLVILILAMYNSNGRISVFYTNPAN